MPPRTNPFQKLILQIEQQLAGQNASVQESASLYEPDGTSREVDVLIELDTGMRSIRIAVECRDHRDKCDVTWIDELDGKYRNLRVDKIVAVSNSGFTGAALAKAVHLHIETLTLTEASTADWSEKVRYYQKFFINRKWFKLENIHVHFSGNTPKISGKKWFQRCQITLAKSMQSGPLETFVYGQLSHPEMRLLAEEKCNLSADKRHTLRLLSPAEATLLLIDPKGLRWPIEYVEATIVLQDETIEIPLTQVDYGKAAVAFGEGSFSDIKLNALVASTEKHQGNPRINFLVTPLSDQEGKKRK